MNTTRLNMTFAIVVIVSAGAFGLGLLFPGLRELDERRKTISREIDDAHSAQVSLGSLSDLYNDVLALKQKAHILWGRVPSEPLQAAFRKELFKCIEENGITNVDIQTMAEREVDPSLLPGELELAANISVLPVQLKFETNFASLFSLLSRIEDMDRLVHIDAITATNDEKSPGRIQVDMTVVAYYRRPA